jgi:hypothetical protein
MAPWVISLATSCQKLQLHITKSLMKVIGTQYLFHPHYLHKIAWPWPSLKSWTSAWHYWHPTNIGTRCIHQTSKLKFHCFYWTNSHHPCFCFDNWQRTNLFTSYPWTILTSILTKPKGKWHIVCSFITSETFNKLGGFWTPFP